MAAVLDESTFLLQNRLQIDSRIESVGSVHESSGSLQILTLFSSRPEMEHPGAIHHALLNYECLKSWTCCSNIFPRNQGRNGCAPKVSRFGCYFLGVERKSVFFPHKNHMHFKSMQKNPNPNHHCPYWFNSTHNIFLKYLFSCVGNKACKSWCIGAHPTLCVISFWTLKIWLNNQARTFIIPVSVLLQAQLIMVNQPKPPGFLDLIIHHAFV